MLVRDVVTSFRRMEAYKQRPQTVYADAVLSGTSAMDVGAIGEREPTLEERVGLLEREVRSVRDEMKKAIEQLAKEARQAAENAAERASRSAEDRFTAIEKALLGDTSRDKVRRLLGVGAVVCGIILATIGSVGS